MEQIVFFATHQLTSVDLRLYRHYSRQLRHAGSSSRLWVLHYRPQSAGVAVSDPTREQLLSMRDGDRVFARPGATKGDGTVGPVSKGSKETSLPWGRPERGVSGVDDDAMCDKAQETGKCGT